LSDPNEILGWRIAPPDKTAVGLEVIGNTIKIRFKDNTEKMQRTFPIRNKLRFLHMENEKIMEDVLRMIKKFGVKASPIDMDKMKESGILDFMNEEELNDFKKEFYRNNPNWESEEEDWKKRKEGWFYNDKKSS
jgi:hypothetical protein